MKKVKIIILGMFVLSNIALIAQADRFSKQKTEEYKSEKIAYITTTMNLTPEEAEVFWPIYNKYSTKKDEMLVSMRDYRVALTDDYDELTEAQAKEAIDYFQKHMKEMNALLIVSQNEYLKVLSAKKVLLLTKAEKDFRRQMLRKLSKGKRRK